MRGGYIDNVNSLYIQTVIIAVKADKPKEEASISRSLEAIKHLERTHADIAFPLDRLKYINSLEMCQALLFGS